MELWHFLTSIFEQYGLALNIDPWFFYVIPKIEFTSIEAIEKLFLDAGFPPLPTGKYWCGATIMVQSDPRTIQEVLLATPDETRCFSVNLVKNIEHELKHVFHWIVEGIVYWVCHE